MNKARSNYLYDLVGIIKEKKKKTTNQRECFKLTVELTNQTNINLIQAYQNKLKNPQIWQDLENSEFIDKRYLFHCRNYFGTYHLVNWKELTPSPKELAGEAKEIQTKNHGQLN